jgi:DNA-binding response OmpR family regulator
LRELRRRGTDVPTIIVSAVRVSPNRLEEFHPLAYLPKPFPLEALLRLVLGGAELVNEKPLRVAASTLSRARVEEMTATTVVGTLGRDDEELFRELVEEMAEEYALHASITLNNGSFSVRFERSDA